MSCGAYVERYTGKGMARVKHAGSCIYERGHEGDHCPPSLANTDWVPVPKIEMAQAKELAQRINVVLEVDPGDSTDIVGDLTRLIASWPDPS